METQQEPIDLAYEQEKARRDKYRQWIIRPARLRINEQGELERAKKGEFVHYQSLCEANNRIAALAESQDQLLQQIRELRELIELRGYIEMDIVKEGRLILLPNTDIVLKLIAHEKENAHGANNDIDTEGADAKAA